MAWGAPLRLLALDGLRAGLFTAAFSTFATQVLSFRPETDADGAAAVGTVAARVRLLIFRATAIVVAVSLAELPTSFVGTFLANPGVAGLGEGKQLALLFAFAAVAIVAVTHIDTRCGGVAAGPKGDKRRMAARCCALLKALSMGERGFPSD